MVNMTHLKVLLTKDFLTLWRNKGFLVAFIFLPVALMTAFASIQGLVDNGKNPGDTLLGEYFFWATNWFVITEQTMGIAVPPPFMGYGPITYDNTTGQPSGFVVSTLQNCQQQNTGKYYFSEVALVKGENVDDQVMTNLDKYFTNYVFPLMQMEGTGLFGKSSPYSATVISADDLDNAVRNDNDMPYCFALYVNEFDAANYNFEFQYSFNKNALPDTNLDSYNPLILAPDITSWNLWQTSGGTQLYTFIIEFVARMYDDPDGSKGRFDINTENPQDASVPEFINQVGYSPTRANQFEDISPIGIQQLSQNFPFFFMFVYLIPFYYLTSKIAAEKESKSREGMKMMGLDDSTFFLSWFILFFFISLVTSAFVTLIAGIKVFTNVNMGLFFAFCMLYAQTLYGWAFMIVAFLPTKRTSGIAATLFHILSYFMCAILQDPNTSSNLQYGLSVLPNVCMAQMIKQVFFYNFQTKDGLDLNTGSIIYQGYSFKGGLLMMTGNVIFYCFLGLYLDQVIPSQFGIAKPWYFCCKKKTVRVQDTNEKQRLLDQDDVGDKDPSNFEGVAPSLKKQEQDNECLKIRGLVKKFGEKTAVKNVNLTMYNGQIFALLGHNGAGKTTTISMLTGLIEANSGFAEVFGIDIFNKMNEMRKILGVCPQHDVLFEFLTAEDHLRLFSAFKGTPAELIDDQVKKMLEEIDLTDQKNMLSKNLSGGQKRKLSVAIAMIGNSQIVLLDEPTSGMDTSARRRLWDMLKKNKQGKIIILTTHYMDEADILGDRIAIMAEGDVQCTGSSLFLKNRYGVGYNLVIAKKSRNPAPQVDEFINRYITDAKKMQEVSSEIQYQLPTSSASQFKTFFTEFDRSLDTLDIRSYGVGITTLEEVFLRIGHGDDVEEARAIKKDENEKADAANTEMVTVDKELEEYSNAEDSELSFVDHTKAILKKKILVQIRDKKTLGIDTVFPVVLIIVGLALATIKTFKDGQSRTMNSSIYPQPNPVYVNKNSFYTNLPDEQSTFTEEQLSTFMSEYMFKDNSQTKYILNPAYEIPEANITDPKNSTLKEFDNYIFDQVNNEGAQQIWGSLYLNDIQQQEFETSTHAAPTYENKFTAWSYQSILLLNSTSQSVVGAWSSDLHKAILQDYLFQRMDPPQTLPEGKEFKFTFIDKPLPLSKQFSAVASTAQGTLSGMLICFAWMMISDSLVQNIIKERQKNVKHQIMVSGCSLSAYWIGNYIADILFQAVPAITGVIFIKVFDIDVPDAWVLFLVNVFTNPAFVYAFSFFFDKDDAGSLVIKMVYIVIGIVGPIACSILQVVNESTKNVENILRWFLYPFPQFSLTFGYMSIANRSLIQFVNKENNAYAIFSNQVALPALVFLLSGIVFYWIIVIGFERKWFDREAYRNANSAGAGSRNTQQEDFQTGLINVNSIDEDITEEENRVKATTPDQLKVRVNNYRKTYGDVVAVDDISFGLEYGECFALLGISGAGKTTLFKSMTGEIYPTRGEVHICGHNIATTNGFEQARKQIGYCPQFDAIFDGLTVLEHLQIYAALKGVKKSLRERMIEKAIREMDLEDYRNIYVNNLSGGNKRKTSVAIALLGNPPLVFLDEPSTGVDPQAKRFMWNIVSKISTLRKKSAVIITTHSLEEAEALCTKMGIMVRGQFKCFGPSQHIKDKYGTGYEIELKIKTLTEQEINQELQKNGFDNQSSIGLQECKAILQKQNNIEAMDDIKEDGIGSEYWQLFEEGKKTNAGDFFRWQFTEKMGNQALDFLEQKFREFKVVEHYGSSWKLKVSRDEYSIGFLFGLMEDIQSQFEISEYSVAQTTLEQIFINFALEAELKAGKKSRGSTKRRKSSASKMKPTPNEGITKS